MSVVKQKKANLEALKLEQMLKTEVNKAYDRGISEGCAKTLILICYILYNSFGFGEGRLKRIVGEVKHLGECMDDGLVNMQDLHDVLKDECRFDIYNGIV